MSDTPEPEDSFERTYSRYAFSELVRLGVAFAKWMARREDERLRGQQHAEPSAISTIQSRAPTL